MPVLLRSRRPGLVPASPPDYPVLVPVPTAHGCLDLDLVFDSGLGDFTAKAFIAYRYQY